MKVMGEITITYMLGGVAVIVIATISSRLLLAGLLKPEKRNGYVSEKLFDIFKDEVNRRFDAIERKLLNIENKIDKIKNG